MDVRLIRVRALGLRPHELIALKSVCRLSQQAGRPIGHELAEPGGAADIFIVAMDDPQSLADWRTSDPQGLIPFVAAGSLPPAVANGVHLPKPFLASRLLAAMDVCAALLKGRGSVDTPTDQEQANELQLSPAAPMPFQAHLPPRRGSSILVVDDSATATRQIEFVLQKMGIQPHCVASGEEALRAVDSYHFDSVLLDVILPGTDGYQVCKAIKKNPRTRHISVIMLTSKTSQFDKIRGKFAGCDSYLTKPLDRADFIDVMQKYVTPVSPGVALSVSDAAGAPSGRAAPVI
jgi:two-component system, cell cycle response regulator